MNSEIQSIYQVKDELILIILILTAAIVTFLLFKKQPKSKPTDTIYMIHKLIKEGLLSFTKKVTSSMIQTIIYLTVILFVLSLIFNSSFYLNQMLSFFIGTIVIIIITLKSLLLLPNQIPEMIKKQDTHPHIGVYNTVKISFKMAYLNIVLIIIGYMICILFLKTNSIIGYGLGIIITSIFLRLGSGLFRTGNNLGTIIANRNNPEYPSFDQRNPGTLLNVISKYVDQYIGFSSDMLGSFILSLIATTLIGIYVTKTNHINNEILILLPIYIVLINMISSLIVFLFNKWRIFNQKLDNCLLEGLYLSLALTGVGVYFLMNNLKVIEGTKLFSSYIIGLIAATLICLLADITTSKRYKSVKLLAKKSSQGTAVTFFEGLMLGLRSNSIYLIILLIAMIITYQLSGIYGIAITSLAMNANMLNFIQLIIYASSASISNNISELSKVNGVSLKNSIKINQIGKTTIAIGNGFASGLSVTSSIALFLSLSQFYEITQINISFKLIIGLMIGMILPFVYSSFLLQSMIQLCQKITHEITRQLTQIPYLLEGKAKPDMYKITDISIGYIMNALIIPAIIVIFIPILIGYLLGLPTLLGTTIGAFLWCLIQGFYWSNSGEAMQQGLDYLKDGHYGGSESPSFQQLKSTANIGKGFQMLLSPATNIFVKVLLSIAALTIGLI